MELSETLRIVDGRFLPANDNTPCRVRAFKPDIGCQWVRRVRECVFDTSHYPHIRRIGDVERYQIQYIIGVKNTVFDCEFLIAGYRYKRQLHRLGRVAVIDHVNTAPDFVDKQVLILYIDFAGVL